MTAVKSETILMLADVGIPTSLMKFKNVTLQKDNLVCVRGEDQISIVDLSTKKVANLKTVVDSVIINPSKNIIGLKSEDNHQVFDLSKKLKLNSTIMDAPVEFWAWLDDDTIGLVTASAVFAWRVSSGEPRRAFSREPFDGRVQVILCAAAAGHDWMLLGGISAAPDGRIDGFLQLHSQSRGRSQVFRGSHAGCFVSLPAAFLGRAGEGDVHLFCFSATTPAGFCLNAVEIAPPPEAAAADAAFRSKAPLAFEPRDFPVCLVPDRAHGLLFALSKGGHLAVTDVQSGETLHSARVSASTLFVSAPAARAGGVVCVAQDGAVRRLSLDRKNVVAALAPGRPGLAASLSVRLGLPVDAALMRRQFEEEIERKRYGEAARLAAGAADGALRTRETIRRFSAAAPAPGEVAPLLQYFSQLLKKGRLRDFESVALLRPILAASSESGRKRVENWVREDKLTASEELGDLLLAHDVGLACSVYLRAQCVEKAAECFVLLGEFGKVEAYARENGADVDYPGLLRRVSKKDGEKAKDFALHAVLSSALPFATAAEILESFTDTKTFTSFLLDAFRSRGDRREDAALQTKLLAANLQSAPAVAQAILDADEYPLSHYDRALVAELSEAAGLFALALEHYADLKDLQRCLTAGLATAKLSRAEALAFFGELAPDEGLLCLEALLAADAAAHGELAVDVALKYSAQMTPAALLALLESAGRPELPYRFLGAQVNSTADPQVVFRFIEAAARSRETQELRRVCKENDVYDPQQVAQFLASCDALPDPRPLITVCDRFGYTEMLARHLLSKNLTPFLATYVQKVNPAAAPVVLRVVLDGRAAPEEPLKTLLAGLPPEALAEAGALDAVLEEALRHGQLALFVPWLEAAAAAGCRLKAVHNALAKACVLADRHPLRFLETNAFYDPLDVAPFLCREDPRLAFAALKRQQPFPPRDNDNPAAARPNRVVPPAPQSTAAAGANPIDTRRAALDEALIHAAAAGGLYAELAEELAERQNEELWVRALAQDEEHRRALIAQVVSALGRTRAPEQISVAVRAFIAAELPKELIELLERLVLTGPAEMGFHANRNLQNLLILTAIKTEPARVRSYVAQLNDYDGDDIAKIAVLDRYRLYEEAFEIYVRFGNEAGAVSVLLEKLGDEARAEAFCAEVDRRPLWERLGEWQLERGEVARAIGSLLRARCARLAPRVMAKAEEAGEWERCAEYMAMVAEELPAETRREAAADLLFCLAKVGRLDEFKACLEREAGAEVEVVGDRCMRDELYEAAKILYEQKGNYCRLALCLVSLGDFEAAAVAAEKASTTQTWKVVCYACVDAGEFELAQKCAVRVASRQEELLELVSHYEQHGYFLPLIGALEETAAGSEKPHIGLLTALGVLYCEHSPEKLMRYLQTHVGRLNGSEMVKKALQYNCWPEAAYVLQKTGQFDRAAEVAIEHSPSVFSHTEFLALAPKVSRADLFFHIIDFYTEEHPLLLNELLCSLKGRVDDTRVINKISERGILPLVKNYLLQCQQSNNAAANKGLIDLYIEEGDSEALKAAIKEHKNYDARALTVELEKHPAAEFRAISAYLFCKIGQMEKGLALYKAEGLFDDLIVAVREAQRRDLAEEALRFFAGRPDARRVAATLLECSGLVRPHVALEVGLVFGLERVVAPFVVQTVSDFENRLQKLEDAEKQRSQSPPQKPAAILGPSKTLRLTRGDQNGVSGAAMPH